MLIRMSAMVKVARHDGHYVTRRLPISNSKCGRGYPGNIQICPIIRVDLPYLGVYKVHILNCSIYLIKFDKYFFLV